MLKGAGGKDLLTIGSDEKKEGQYWDETVLNNGDLIVGATGYLDADTIQGIQFLIYNGIEVTSAFRKR